MGLGDRIQDILYFSGKIGVGILSVVGISVVVGNIYIGADTFLKVNGIDTLNEHVSLNSAESRIYNTNSNWSEDPLAATFYTLTIPGRESGYWMGRFYRGATTHDKTGMDGWPGNPRW